MPKQLECKFDPMYLSIRCSTAQEKLLAMFFLAYWTHLEMNHDSLNYLINNVVDHTPYKEVKRICDNQIGITSYPDGTDHKINFSDILKTFSYSLDEVKLNSEYTAKVTPDNIQVGCQTISLEKFDELAKVVERVRRKS